MRLFGNMRFNAALALSALFLSLPPRADEGLPQLDTSLFPEQLFWLAVTFAVLYVLMSGVALPRVAKTQGTRKQVIATELEAARVANDNAKATVTALEKSLSTARANAQATVSEMVAEVTQSSQEQQAKQEKELLHRLRRAEEDIAVTREAALQSIRSSAADLAAMAVAKIISAR